MKKKVGTQVSLDKTALLYALSKAAAVAATGASQLALYKGLKLTTEDGALVVLGSNETNLMVVRCPGDVEAGDFPDALVPASLVSLVGAMRGDAITIARDGNQVRVSDGMESFKLSAVFDDSEFENNSIAYRPADYRPVPTRDGAAANHMTSQLWNRIVTRGNAVEIEESSIQSGGLSIKVDAGRLTITAFSQVAMMTWDIAPSQGYDAAADMVALVPKTSISAVQVSGNDVEFGLLAGGRIFFVSDITGILEFYCPIITSPFPDMAGVLAIPTPVGLTMTTEELTRYCRIASHYQLVVGEGKGTVRTGRVRLMSDGQQLKFYTASQDGDYDGGVAEAEVNGEFDVTLANKPLAAAARIFDSGKFSMGIAPNKIQMVGIPDDGAVFVMAPMHPNWKE